MSQDIYATSKAEFLHVLHGLLSILHESRCNTRPYILDVTAIRKLGTRKSHEILIHHPATCYCNDDYHPHELLIHPPTTC